MVVVCNPRIQNLITLLCHMMQVSRLQEVVEHTDHLGDFTTMVK